MPNSDLPTLPVPEHVPPSVVVDLDIYDLARADEDVQLAWRRFTGQGPLVYSPRNGGHWIATEGDDIRSLYRDTTHLSLRDGGAIPPHGGLHLLPNQSDPPELEDYRRAMMPFFAPPVIDALIPSIRKLAIELIETIQPRGECEFIADFASHLPIIVFLKIMGLPISDRPHLLALADNFARNPDVAAKAKSMQAVNAYIEDRIAERRAKPGDDIISAMLAAQVGDRPFNDDEVRASCVMLMLAGLDTVVALMGFVAAFLASNPSQRANIRARGGQLAAIVEELLRRFGVANLGRLVIKDLTLHGVTMKAGDRVLLSTVLYNLDEKRFPAPAQVNFNRGRVNHLTFGSGPHACIGAYLARSELAIFLEEWLMRIPDFDIAHHGRPKAASGSIDALIALPLRWVS